MTLDLAQNVPIHTLKVNYSKLKIDLREPRPQKADLYLRPKQGQSS